MKFFLIMNNIFYHFFILFLLTFNKQINKYDMC